jgi:hypothetical protein
MNFLRSIQTAVLRAAGGLALLSIVGCGGGGGGNPTVNYAPVSINGRTLIIRDPSVLVDTSYAFEAGVYKTNGLEGTYIYGRTGVLHQATLSTTLQTTNVTSTYTLTFDSPAGGRYKVRKVSSGSSALDEESTFSIQ